MSKKISLSAIRNDSLKDTAIQIALNKLHESNYNFWRAMQFWVNKNGPVMVTDQCEIWIENEVAHFEEGLALFGKNFGKIKREMMRWKSVSNIIEFYYMWKTTSRYISVRLKKLHDPENSKAREMKSCKVRKSNIPHSMKYDILPRDGKEQRRCDICGQNTDIRNFYYITSPSVRTVCEKCWQFWKCVTLYQSANSSNNVQLNKSSLIGF